MHKNCIVALVICSLAAMNCGHKQDDANGKLLTTKQMQLILWDLFQADAYSQYYLVKDSGKNTALETAGLQKKIFDLHKISREDFNASYAYYSSKPSMMRVILDSISAYGERQRNDVLKERYSGEKPPVD